MLTKSIVFLITYTLCLHSANADFDRLDFCPHVELYGLKCEKYYVTTEDGYILGTQRVTNGNPNNSTLPVLFWHGAVGSSDTLLIRENLSSVVAMAQAGYDVFMGNSRGDLYSRNHTTLDPDSAEFWDFTFNEMGYYDVPATIDFVLNITGHKILTGMGHSRGTTIFFVLTSLRPEYNDNLQVFIALAPVAFFLGQKNMAVLASSIYLYDILRTVGVYEAFAADSVETKAIQELCSQGTVGYNLCLGLVMQMAGYDPEQMTPAIYHQFLTYYFGGNAVKDGIHFLQLQSSGRFAKYDYGPAQNLLRYGSITSPSYDLSQVSMPVAMVCGANDKITTLTDVARLRGGLPNVVSYQVLARPQYNHLDFVYGKDIDTDLNPVVLDLLQKYGNV